MRNAVCTGNQHVSASACRLTTPARLQRHPAGGLSPGNPGPWGHPLLPGWTTLPPPRSWTPALRTREGQAAPKHQNRNFWNDLTAGYCLKLKRNEEKSEFCRVRVYKCFHPDVHVAAQRGSLRLPPHHQGALGPALCPLSSAILGPRNQEPTNLHSEPPCLFKRYGWKIPFILADNLNSLLIEQK